MRIRGLNAAFILLFSGYALFLVSALPSYGPTWDVLLEFPRATAYLDNILGNTTPSRISPWHQLSYEKAQSSYGGSLNGCLPSIIAAASGKILFEKLGLTNYIDAYHFGLVLLWLVFIIHFYAMLSKLHDRRLALVATVLLALAPRVLGHVPNNMKDIPALAFATSSVLELAVAVTHNRPRRIFLAGLLFACAISSKFTAAIVVVPALVFLYQSFRKSDIPKAFLLPIVAVPFITIAVFFIHWPYLWALPPSLWKRLAALVAFIGIRKGGGVPTFYPVVMAMATTPPLILFGLSLAPIVSFRPPPLKRHETLLLVLYTSWMFIVLLVYCTGRIALFDGVRHFLLFLPPATVLAAWGITRAFDMVNKESRFLRNIPRRRSEVLVGLAILGVSILPVISYHPYETTYFNTFVGGLRGATLIRFGPEVLDYEPRDYWGTSIRSIIKWVNHSLPDGSTLWISIPPELGASFTLRTGLSFVRPDRRQPGKPFYLIFINRKDFFTRLEYEAMIKGKLVHKVSIKGVPLSYVYKMPEIR